MSHNKQEQIEDSVEEQAEKRAEDHGISHGEPSAQQASQNAPSTASQEQGADGDDDSTQADLAEDVTIEDPTDVIARLETEVAEARAMADEYLDRMQRAAAEFQNVRKRQERQLQQSLDRSTERVIRHLLPILDDFELAFNNVPDTLKDDEEAWSQGFQRIQQKLISLLQDEGVRAMEQTGAFDPNRHEAVTNEPNADVESGHIIETIRTGYEYKDRVLRPALVRVAQ